MAAGERIYLDCAATTPLDERVARAMVPYWHEVYGNPSSLHHEGLAAREALEEARATLAGLLGAASDEVVFTSGGTESDNMAIVGVFQTFAGKPFHMVTSAAEHPAVLETARFLERLGADVTYLPSGSDGVIDPGRVEEALRPETRLISLMAANNVTGVVQPVGAVAALARRHGVLFHCDAVQAFGKIHLPGGADRPDMISISGHKIYGPKGVGALYMRRGIACSPLLHGGGQENGRRPSTHNVAGIVGLAAAARLCGESMSEEACRLVNLRDELLHGLQRLYSGVYLIGHPHRRLPGHLCLGFAGLEGEAVKLLLALDEAGIAVSTGSACSSAKAGQPSYVLQSMGFDPVRARGSLRLTLGRSSRAEHIQRVLDAFRTVLRGLRPVATFSQMG